MRFNLVTILGLILILVGVVALVMKGISYTDRDTVVDAGPIEITTEQDKTIPISPIVGGLGLGGGLALVVVGSKAKP
jgi:hypothetical protein